MSLFIMAVYDTEENGRSEYTERTLESLRKTVDWSKHRMVIVDNGSCERTKSILKDFYNGSLYCKSIRERVKQVDQHYEFYFDDNLIITTNPSNVGTARAINQGLALRKPGEFCVKLDNDVVIHQQGWVEQLEAAIERDPTIGVLGLKRKDLLQSPTNEAWRSELRQLPHEAGQTWITVEIHRDIMGTCTMLNWRLLDVLGGYASPSIYGFDDSLMNVRSIVVGFYNAFLSHIEIEHIDTGASPYTGEKSALATKHWSEYQQWHYAYLNGERPVWEDYY